jgi:hypothetical protein
MDPISLLISLTLMVASMLISSLMMKNQNVKPASLEDFEFPQADEGTPQSRLFGQAWNPGWQVLWYGQLKTKKIKSSGKK